jgi:hypothetical protein
MRFDFDTSSVDDYETFLKIRRLPIYRFRGTSAEVPDEYAANLGVKIRKARSAKYELTLVMDRAWQCMTTCWKTLHTELSKNSCLTEIKHTTNPS